MRCVPLPLILLIEAVRGCIRCVCPTLAQHTAIRYIVCTHLQLAVEIRSLALCLSSRAHFSPRFFSNELGMDYDPERYTDAIIQRRLARGAQAQWQDRVVEMMLDWIVSGCSPSEDGSRPSSDVAAAAAAAAPSAQSAMTCALPGSLATTVERFLHHRQEAIREEFSPQLMAGCADVAPEDSPDSLTTERVLDLVYLYVTRNFGSMSVSPDDDAAHRCPHNGRLIVVHSIGTPHATVHVAAPSIASADAETAPVTPQRRRGGRRDGTVSSPTEKRGAEDNAGAASSKRSRHGKSRAPKDASHGRLGRNREGDLEDVTDTRYQPPSDDDDDDEWA